jgi:hypothetical protein
MVLLADSKVAECRLKWRISYIVDKNGMFDKVTFAKWRISVPFSATLFYQLFCWQMSIIVEDYIILLHKNNKQMM